VDDARLGESANRGVLRLRQRFGHAVFAFVEGVLLEPSQRPAAVGVEISFLFGQRFIKRCVDQRQRLAHGDGLALGVEDFGVAGVNAHARANGGLRQIHRRDVARLEVS
jgi:hypothetical protein